MKLIEIHPRAALCRVKKGTDLFAILACRRQFCPLLYESNPSWSESSFRPVILSPTLSAGAWRRLAWCSRTERDHGKGILEAWRLGKVQGELLQETFEAWT
jgi:hypothetical protein